MTDRMLLNIFLIFGTLFFASMGIYSVHLFKSCTVPVEATLIETTCLKRQYTPIIRYTYNSVVYEVSTVNALSKRKTRKFRQLHTFTVYISPNKPRKATVTRFNSAGWISLCYTLLYIFLIYVFNSHK